MRWSFSKNTYEWE